MQSQRTTRHTFRSISGLAVVACIASSGCAAQKSGAAEPVSAEGAATVDYGASRDYAGPSDQPMMPIEQAEAEEVSPADDEADMDRAPVAAAKTSAAPEAKREERSRRPRPLRGKNRSRAKNKKDAGAGAPGITGAIAAEPPPVAPIYKAPPPTQQDPQFNTEGYEHIQENDFLAVADEPLSTFSIDVDTASYSNVRRFLTQGSLPPADAVRIEELVNYFSYDYAPPKGDTPFAVHTETADCPWNADSKLVKVGIKGKEIAADRVPPRNLVFLLDVSGSMNSPDKLPLLKQSMMMLVRDMRPQDKMSIVVYAGASGVVLEPTDGRHKAQIAEALDRLSAGGSTNGAAGIELAYKLAQKNFDKNGINRVILATDGDFNVGTTSQGELTRLIERKRRGGVFLSVLGFGSGNVKDGTMEMLADKGNGNYAYIDSAREADKVLVKEAGATLVTIAKDVKIQVEFNPSEVVAYRLIGYENRKLANKDFNDDTKDAGEIGAGHSITALYEVVTTDRATANPQVDPLRYQGEGNLTSASSNGELMFLKMRYKQPQGARSRLITFPITDADQGIEEASNDLRFAASVAEFGMLLRGSKYSGTSTFASARKLASTAMGQDGGGYRREFLSLIDMAARLKGESTQASAIAR